MTSRPSDRPRPARQASPPPSPDAPPRPGEVLWTTRAGSEADLIEELSAAGLAARQFQEAVVLSAAPRPPRSGERAFEPAFARQGLPIQVIVQVIAASAAPRDDADAIATVAAALAQRLTRGFALQLFVPDSDPGNRLAGELPALEAALLAALPEPLRAQRLPDGVAAFEAGGLLAQVCILPRGGDHPGALLLGGVVRASEAHSLAPGGRLRFHVDRDAPSRSAMKLGEALAWLGRGPEAGEVCVDLGASPGGWTYILHRRRAHVVAVDLGSLAPSLRDQKGIEHLRMDAFRFAPEIPADWLFCDMAFRPLEVAALLAKWGRKHWARFLVANIKLPMARRAAMLARVKEILATGGWTGLRARQLYHDRDEVTIAAWRGFGADARPPQQKKPAAAPPRPDQKTTAKPPGKPSGPKGSKKTSPRPAAKPARAPAKPARTPRGPSAGHPGRPGRPASPPNHSARTPDRPRPAR